MKTIPFALPFILKVDYHLSKIYSKTLKRERFFALLLLIERQSAKHPIKELRYKKARLKAAYVMKLIGRNYQEYIKILIEKGILNTDNFYMEGQKSKDYWTTNKFKKSVTMDSLILSSGIEITDNLYLKLRKERLRPNKDYLQYQYDLLESDKFIFNVKLANEWLKNEVENGLDINSNKYNCYKRMIFDLETKDIITVEDEKTGRIFTSFNLCKRELRQFCFIKNDEWDEQIHLDSFDLKSSQPYLLASLLLKENPDNKDVLKFYDIVTKRDIYEYFLYHFKTIYPDGFITEDQVMNLKTRDDIKPEFLKVLFKDNRGFAVLEKIFKQEFSGVLKFIQDKKRKQSNKLALNLQQEESNIFISAYKECIKQKIDCLTVHDSLYFKEINKDKVYLILTNIFNSLGYINYKLI